MVPARVELKGEDGIDPTMKEEYLDDAEFEAVFKRTREEYKALPRWKQAILKKDVSLF
jgi:Villin headpiece domain